MYVMRRQAREGSPGGLADDGQTPDSLFLGVSWDDAGGAWAAELWDG